MLGVKRRPGELGYEHRTRAHRAARAQIHAHSQRWSRVWLLSFWDYMGHCARASSQEFPPASCLFLQYRDLQWWQREQARPTGYRHGGRFFPRLMGMEKCLDEIAGGPWKHTALDRANWKRLRDAWLGGSHGHRMDAYEPAQSVKRVMWQSSWSM